MNKILIFGNSGSGKSTLAEKLSATLNIPAYHLDILCLDAQWNRYSDEEVLPKLRTIIKGDQWVIDGHYKRLLYEERIKAADTIIFLDIHPLLCFWRCLRRVVQTRVLQHKRAGATAQHRDGISWKFAHWILWKYPKETRPIVLNTLQEFPGDLVHLKSARETAEYLQNLK